MNRQPAAWVLDRRSVGGERRIGNWVRHLCQQFQKLSQNKTQMMVFKLALCEPTDTSHTACRAPATIDVRRSIMRRLLGGTTLLLALAGCVSGDIYRDEPIKPAPINQSGPSVGPSPQSVPQNLSPAARVAAPKTDGNESKGGALMECVTKSCKINCSPKIKKQFRPKWCVNFKEPAVE